MAIILTTLYWFFAIFGMLQMLKCMIGFLFEIIHREEVIVVKVKNQAEHVEGIIRSLVWKNLDGGTRVPSILVVDLNSTDDTLEILQNLSKRYDFIKVASNEEYLDFM